MYSIPYTAANVRQIKKAAARLLQEPPRGLLVSVAMQAAQGRTTTELDAAGAGDVRFLTWLRTPMADFDRQHFARDVLARWVQDVGASTLYPFTPRTADNDRPQAARLIKCLVAVKTEDGETTYDGLFPSTCDAVIDAQARVGMRPCKVSVKVRP
jgi:hypothetical protein